MEQTGLLNWANSIRLTMAGDPGRQVFKDQVQTHGFMFLDDYLDNIVSGARADPLIELVKTPGRKRAIARKPKLTTSKLNNNIFSLPEEPSDIENFVPVDPSDVPPVHDILATKGFQRAEKNPQKNDSSSTQTLDRSPLLSVQPISNQGSQTIIDDRGHDLYSLPPPAVEAILPTERTSVKPAVRLSEDIKDLSVIAEVDESSERSRPTSNIAPTPPQLVTENNVHILDKPRLSELFQDVAQEDPTVTSRSSSQSMHSIALNSSNDQAGFAVPLGSPRVLSVRNNAKDDEVSPEYLSDDEDVDVAMPDVDATDSLPAAVAQIVDKPIASLFPTLPEPMAIMKPRAPSLNAVMLGSATPGGPVGGKRSSSTWLMKTRERKALEVPAKKTPSATFTLPPDFVPSMAQSTKRKSGDVTDKAVESDERQAKVHKTLEGSSAPHNTTDYETLVKDPPMEVVSQEGAYDRLKKTVEGFGVRKTLNKSLGGAALAEAKAAAEAKVAERDRREEEMTKAMGAPLPTTNRPGSETGASSARKGQDRLSISDLFPSEGKVREKDRVRDKPFQFTPSFTPTRNNKEKEREAFKAHERTSTTPAHSPPSQAKSKILQAPTFSKPVPVFAPPPPVVVKAPVFEPPTPVFRPPTAAKVTPSSLQSVFAAPLTAQSTLETVQDDIFDDTIPPWQPNTQDTQDTDYTSAYDSQSQQQGTQICDEDDSWPLDEKLAAGVQWTFSGSKEDSMTWSTLPSQSHRADTGPLASKSPAMNATSYKDVVKPSHQVPGTFEIEADIAMHEDDYQDTELEDIIIGSSKTSTKQESTIPRSQSQMSMASSESSQSQGGFLTQASKLLSSALGTNKKKPEVKKVLQMAASAAKKQQEEADKKAARLKDMETRRQQALQRKAEEEKSKSLAEERKLKEEADRRKRERDDQTDKKALKPSGSKKEEESQKKRKIELEKKAEIKKPGPAILTGKSHLKSALKQPSSHGFGTQTSGAESSTTLNKGKGMATQQSAMLDDEISQPSHLLHSQMAARAKAKIDAARNIVPSESIELPDINSEYSDSDDEDRVRTFDPPEWAQSPELRQALEVQSTVNPDDIFGPVRPLRMEEIFNTRAGKFRARSSSANWTGTDRLTMKEESAYARRMGFK